ncbi:MAG: hypothetical protein WEB50_09575 [Vicinamibacterales bacterium]
MSPLACEVRNRFEAVYGSELVRLRRKTAALSAADREAVEVLSAQVMQAFSASIEAMLDGRLEADVEQMVRRIFALTPPDGTGSSPASTS